MKNLDYFNLQKKQKIVDRLFNYENNCYMQL